MRIVTALVVFGLLLTAGCQEQTETASTNNSTNSTDESTSAADGRPTNDPSDEPANEPTNEPTGEPANNPSGPTNGPNLTTASREETSQPDEVGALTAVPVRDGLVVLTPDNTTIQFVGKHTDDRPDRVGVFNRFTGEAKIDPATNSLEAVTLDIETESLQTPFERLNGHLRSADFFDARQFPAARFVSKKVEPAEGDAGTHLITGDLTLLETTKEIEIPVTVSVGGDGLTVAASFVLDRTEFGMDLLQEGVKKEVDMTVLVGKKTEPPQAE